MRLGDSTEATPEGRPGEGENRCTVAVSGNEHSAVATPLVVNWRIDPFPLLHAIRIVLRKLLAIWATVGGQMDRLFRNSPQATTLKMDTPTAFASMPRVGPSWESQ